MHPVDSALHTKVLRAARERAFPCDLEDHTFTGSIFTGTHGETYIRYRDIIKQVDSQVFKVREGEIFGIKVPTFDPRTHFHLVALRGMRYKDKINLHEYGNLIKNEVEILPEKLFEPFHELYREQKNRYPMDITVRKARYLYHKHIPFVLRQELKKITVPVRTVLKHEHL